MPHHELASTAHTWELCSWRGLASLPSRPMGELMRRRVRQRACVRQPVQHLRAAPRRLNRHAHAHQACAARLGAVHARRHCDSSLHMMPVLAHDIANLLQGVVIERRIRVTARPEQDGGRKQLLA